MKEEQLSFEELLNKESDSTFVEKISKQQ